MIKFGKWGFRKEGRGLGEPNKNVLPIRIREEPGAYNETSAAARGSSLRNVG